MQDFLLLKYLSYKIIQNQNERTADNAVRTQIKIFLNI